MEEDIQEKFSTNETKEFATIEIQRHWTFWVGKLGYAVFAVLFFLIAKAIFKSLIHIESKIWLNFAISIFIVIGLVAGHVLNTLLIHHGTKVLQKKIDKEEMLL